MFTICYAILLCSVSPQEPPPPPPPEADWSDEETEVNILSSDKFKPFTKKKKHSLVMFYAPCKYYLLFLILSVYCENVGNTEANTKLLWYFFLKKCWNDVSQYLFHKVIMQILMTILNEIYVWYKLLCQSVSKPSIFK